MHCQDRAGGPQARAARGATRRRAARTTLLGAMALVAGACSAATPIPPRSPLALDNATPALPAFVASSPTPGPAPTTRPALTRVVPPLEPLSLPPGFGVGVFADLGLPVSGLATAPNGDLFVSVPSEDRILVLPDRDADGVLDDGALAVYAEGGVLRRPYGIVVRPGWLYVASTDAVLRLPYADGDLQPSGPAERLAELPPDGDQWARPLDMGPDGKLYVGVGASCNVCEETDVRRAAVLQIDPESGESKIYSAGLRSPMGLAFHPATGDLWASDRGRIGLGDDRVPDELNRLSPGAHFGWPYCYGAQRRDTTLAAEPGFCGATLAPMVELLGQAGVAGLRFYDGLQFPETYRGDLYVALSGSGLRRELPGGYNIVRVPMNGWAPRGDVFDFASGWLRPDTRRWGSPVDLELAADGALLVSDEGGGRIYRIYYAGDPEATPESP
ncbi:MAG: PQQ-dependent sugar dehydrogenase [Caldilineae bacterium]|nr:PQQ-dependent sugar dehydrogenase [Caldilineae bacterium]